MTENKNSRTIYTKNELHLGDNIFCCIVFDKISDYIEKNNIFINHYCTPDNVEQVSEFPNTKNIKILPLDQMPKNEKIIDLWIGSEDYTYNVFKSKEPYNDFLLKFYNTILKQIDIPIIIDDFAFDNDELLDREKKINEKTHNKYKNIDFLFLNGEPRSGQLNYDKKEWDGIIKRFSEKYNIVTTQKIEEFSYPFNDNWTVFRFAFKNNLQNLIIYGFNTDKVYYEIANITTGIALSSVPNAVRIGITWQGNFPVNIKNVSFNGTVSGE
jgi:hypothetical protein